MNYYKIIREDKTHNGFKFQEGLNVDTVPFNPSESCQKGGIYFAKKDILAFLWTGTLICEVTLPEDARVYKDPGKPEKWKADKIVLGKFRKITLDVIKELIENSADIRADDDYALKWASSKGRLEVIKCLVENGANVHIYYDCALRWASSSGHLDIVKYLNKVGKYHKESIK